MTSDKTKANEVYILEVDQPNNSLVGWFLFSQPVQREPVGGHAGVAVVRKRDRKIVVIINDDSWDSQDVRAQMAIDIDAMSAFDFEQTYGVNTFR